MRNKFPSITLMLFATVGVAWAQERDAQQIEKELMRSYKNRVLILREFHSGNHLEYDAQGQFLKGGTIGPWTVDGEIRVSSIRRRNHLLEIEAKRLHLLYDQQKKHFDANEADKVSIQIELNEPELDSASRVLSKVVLAPEEKLEDIAPSFWRPFLSGKFPTPPKTPKEEKPTAPVPVQTLEPPYTVVAREARLNGTLVLSIVIDEHGDVKDIVLMTPLGLGLDENAVQAVSGWKFRPAMRHGIPAPVRVMVEVTFRM